MQTFSNHVASIRAICKIKVSEPEDDTVQHLVVSGGSRLQANVYRLIQHKGSKTYSMGHICHFMRSFEHHDNDQDLRVMAVTAVK